MCVDVFVSVSEAVCGLFHPSFFGLFCLLSGKQVSNGCAVTDSTELAETGAPIMNYLVN